MFDEIGLVVRSPSQYLRLCIFGYTDYDLYMHMWWIQYAIFVSEGSHKCAAQRRCNRSARDQTKGGDEI